MSVKDKVVLVTGASAGIGAAIAIKFSEKGANVAIVGRNEKRLNNIAKECEKYFNKPLVIVADVSKDDDARRIISNTINHFGKIDVLVNNAGIPGTGSIFDNNIMKVFDEVTQTNLRAAVYLTHLAAMHLAESKGNIINISSIAAHSVTSKTSFSYAATKAALDHFSRCIALEFAAKGVRVNCVNPGPVKTDMIDKLPSQREETAKLYALTIEATALKKDVSSEEVADLVVYLASDKAKSITGSSYIIDNGALLRSVFDF